MTNPNKVQASKKHKPYSFSAEPDVFDPVLEKIRALAIEKRSSSSFIITDIILSYFNMENTTEQSYDFSKRIKNRNQRSKT